MSATQCLNGAVAERGAELTAMGWETFGSQWSKSLAKLSVAIIRIQESKQTFRAKSCVLWKHDKDCLWQRSLCSLSSEGWGKISLEFPKFQQEHNFTWNALPALPPHLASWHCGSFGKARRSSQSSFRRLSHSFLVKKEIWVQESHGIRWHALTVGLGTVPPGETQHHQHLICINIELEILNPRYYTLV